MEGLWRGEGGHKNGRTSCRPHALPVTFRMDEHDLFPQRLPDLHADHSRRQAAVCVQLRALVLRRYRELSIHALRSLLKMPVMRAGCSGCGSFESTVFGSGACRVMRAE